MFFLVNDGKMNENIFFSFNEAEVASKDITVTTVKVTTLDQVMYPLILKRGKSNQLLLPKR